MMKLIHASASFVIGWCFFAFPFIGTGQQQASLAWGGSDAQVVSSLNGGNNNPQFILMAPAANLDQYRNGPFDAPINTCFNWVNGNAGEQNSHYIEGWSIPYRCVMTDLPLNTSITLTLGYDIRHSGKNALDYLTYYHRMTPHDIYCDQTHNMPECVTPAAGIFSTFPIPAPSSVGSPVPGMPTASFNNLPASERLMVLYGGTITGIAYNTQGDLNANQAETRIDVTFTVTETTATLAWGGHIASRLDWGEGNSAGGITGSPYHMRLIDWNLNNLGNQDRSLSAGAVGPPCSVTGPDSVCAGSTQQYCVTNQAGITYNWTVSGGGAVIVGSNTGNCVEIQAGDGDYSVMVSLSTNDGFCVDCSMSVVVEPIGVCMIDGNSVVCPGATTQHCASPGGTSWAWSISGSASIIGPADQECVNVSAADNCNSSYTLTLSVDGALCGSTCTKTVLIQDITPPEITCPVGITVSCASEVPAPDLDALTVSDNCLAPVIKSHVGDVISNQTCADRYTLTRTYMATDACDNTAICTQTITVNDQTAPTVACPAGITVSCTSEVPAADPSALIVSDNCGGSVTKSFVGDVISDQTCPDRYTLTRTYMATDACGNTATCTQIITVNDQTPPAITCPTDITVSCASEVPAPDINAPTASDNCGSPVTVSFVDDAIFNLLCANQFLVVRTYNATDACGNSTTCSQKITVFDQTSPSVTCPSNTSVSCAADVPAPDPDALVVSDNCGGTVTTEHVGDVISNQTCPDNYTLTRTYMATDACGNTATCEQVITVNDQTGPVITCSTQTSPVECPATPQWIAPSATDACGSIPTITFNDVTTPGACPQEYSVTRTWTATDACMNASTCSRTIVVQDNTAPIITCAAQMSPVECPATPQWVAATAADACDPSPVVTFSDVTTPGACAQEYSVTRTWTATDACMNASTCSRTIAVEDNTAPVITCATQISPVECPATPQWVAPSVADACDPLPVVTFNDVTTPGACAQEYSVTRTWTATDACMNASTCSRTISVEDNTAPVITCAAQISPVECPATPQWVAPTVADACDAAPTVTFNDVTTPGACPQEYSVTRTWTATDACMNASTCSRTISVEDNTAPVVTCAAQVTPVECPAMPQWVAPTVTDACDATPTVTFNDVTTPGACPQEYSVTRTWTATDACMNASTCSRTITVEDNTAPVVTCVTQISPIECPSTPQWFAPNVTDACDGAPTVTFNDVTTPGACPQEYSVTRTWTATDACMNASTCSRTISVEDNTAPIITCASQSSPVECPATPQWVAPTATDACDAAPTITFSDVTTPGACSQEYSVTRIWTATDACMNASTCSRTISVEDNTAPVITCASQSSPVECPAMPQWVAATATDACDATPTVTFNDVTTPGACPQEYSVTRTWTATDDCMNSSTCSRTIIVEDNTAPVVTCATQTSPIECPATPQWVAATAADACDPSPVVTFSDVTTPGACPQEYNVTRTWTATDACMNASTCSRTIVVQDNTAPVITCAAQMSPVECPATPQWVAPSVADACDAAPVVTFSDVTTPGACPQEYSVTRTWTATDACMNASTCSRTIVVEDNTAPVITCAAQVSPVECLATPQWVAPSVADACDAAPVVTFSDVTTPGACAQEYSVTRTWTATDACMNASTCSRTIVVEDNTAPVITCAAQVSPVECPATPQWVAPTVADVCDAAPTVTFNDVTTPGACPQEYSVTRTWTATDACMNASTCSRTIAVEDNTAPDIACAPITVSCASEVPAPDPNALMVSDNCGGAVTVSHVGDVISNQTCPDNYTLTRTYMATDACGNTATCEQIITVNDQVGPNIICPAGTIVPCATAVPSADPTIIGATDNCGGPVIIVHVGDVISNQICPDNYTLTRTYLATDECGNTATCDQIISVLDDSPPIIICPDPITVDCADEIPAPDTSLVFALDTSLCNTCKAFCTYTQGAYGNAGGIHSNGLNTSETLDILLMAGPIVVGGGSGNCGFEVATTQCVLDILSAGGPSDPLPQNYMLDCTQALDNNLAGQVIALQLNVRYNLEFNDGLDLGAAALSCVLIPDQIEELDLDSEATVNDLLALSNLYLASICNGSIYPGGFGGLLASATTAINEFWDECQQQPGPGGGGTVITFVSDEITNQTCDNRYTVIRTYQAEDECGNIATCTQTITVDDQTAPVITCAAQTSPVECPATPQWVAPTVTDNCGGTPTVTFSDVTTPGACAQEYSVTRTWTATDDCLNTSTCSRTIAVNDQAAPTAYFIVNGIPNATEAYEICGEVDLVLDRAGINPSQPLTITLTISGTATSGADYSPLNASYIIPAGQNQLIIPITIVDDMLTEGSETIVISFGQSCSCDKTEKTLKISDLTTAITLTCPSDITVDTDPAVVVYTPPLATTDCPCPGIELELTEGLPSGSVFPLGTTTVCYIARDSCGNTATCCFNVTVVEAPELPCDEVIAGCVKFELIEITEDNAGNNTYKIRVTNNCVNKLMYVAFSLPPGVTALAPPNNSIYTAPSGNEYSVRNPNFSPFYSIRFYSAIVGIASGASDIFEYTLPSLANPPFIHVIVRLQPKIFLEGYLSTADCIVEPEPKPGPKKAGLATFKNLTDRVPGHFTVFPNPTTGLLFADLTEWQGEQVQVQVFDSRGGRIQQTALTADVAPQEIQLPKDLPGGLYFLEIVTETGERQTVRFMLQR